MEGADNQTETFTQERDQLAELLRQDPQNAKVMVSLANLLIQRGKELEVVLQQCPSEQKQPLLWEISALRMEADELYSKATETEPSVPQGMAVSSCTWRMPPQPGLSFRAVQQDDEEEEVPSDYMDEDDDDGEEEDSSDEVHNAAQERHMFELARNQYECVLSRQGNDARLRLRYAQLLIGRMEGVGRDYPEEEMKAYLQRAEALLKEVQLLDPSLDLQPDFEHISSLLHNKRKRV